jgi:hypothetical protein
VTRWASYRIDAVGLELDVVDSVPVDAELGPRDGHVLQWADELQIGVWYGAEGTIERWSSGIAESWPQAVLGPEDTIALAGGLTARRRVAQLPPDRAEGGFQSACGGVELRARETPAREVTAVALERDGVPVLASVMAAGTGRREAEHVVASLRAV